VPNGAGVTGDPEQVYAGIRVADVVLAIRDLEPGFHSQEEVRVRYYELTGQERNADQRHVSTIVSKLGLTRYQRDGERGWTIDPAKLAPRWPRLPFRA
jgi:hypothetical protein